jgi:protein-disulfide isomerase/uncharacterized membrane protein
MNYTDIGYQSFCAISTAINCDTVSQSAYSVVAGLPVPVWGLIGFVFLLELVLLCWRRSALGAQHWAVVFWVALSFALTSVILAAVSIFLIRSYCIMCIGVHLVSFFTLWFSWLIHRRFASLGLIANTVNDFKCMWRKRRWLVPLFSATLAGVILTYIFMPAYWQMSTPRLSGHIPKGMTAQDHPWLGASEPQVEILVFSDYQCFQCKKMHLYLRHLVERYPDKIRIVHRHYPMDHEVNPIVKSSFHRGSGKMALLAIYAATQNKFWTMNDALFHLAGRQKTIDLKALARRTGLEAVDLFKALRDPRIHRRLKMDLNDGIQFGIDGTPSFVIDGQVYPGTIPPEIIGRILTSPPSKTGRGMD